MGKLKNLENQSIFMQAVVLSITWYNLPESSEWTILFSVILMLFQYLSLVPIAAETFFIISVTVSHCKEFCQQFWTIKSRFCTN